MTQIGKDLQNVLIAFFAPLSVVEFCTSAGALFQILAASTLKLDWEICFFRCVFKDPVVLRSQVYAGFSCYFVIRFQFINDSTKYRLFTVPGRSISLICCCYEIRYSWTKHNFNISLW